MPDEVQLETTSTNDHIFSVKTEVFEGPIELLIELIEKRKLLINDISLAAVTDEYMQKVAQMEQNPLRETTHFVALAATLLLIKSKSLLPVLKLTEEEEETIEDLQDRLKLYAIFRDAGKFVTEGFGVRIAYEREFVPSSQPIFVTDQFTELSALKQIMNDLVKNLPKPVVKPKVQVKKTVSLEDVMNNLKDRIERQMKFYFREFTGNSTERGTVIVSFLAVLEMVKQGNVLVRQTGRFEDIEIEREGIPVPRYM